MASIAWTLRSRRPYARREVYCMEPGRSHPRPELVGQTHEGEICKMSKQKDEKSDRAIVPKKIPNKGNHQQVTGVRTQRRVAATIGLLKVRYAAKRDKRTRFSALFHHTSQSMFWKRATSRSKENRLRDLMG